MWEFDRAPGRLPLAVLGLVTAAVLVSSCGYTLAGRGGSLPEHIKIIGIPQFTNRSTLPDIDRVVTDKVRDEFGSRGKYRVNLEADGADAVLTGTITGAVSTPTSLVTGSRQASSYSMVVTLSVEFKDVKSNKVLWSNPAMQVREEYDLPTGASVSDPSAFFRQDTNALERLARNLARSIATAVFEAM